MILHYTTSGDMDSKGNISIGYQKDVNRPPPGIDTLKTDSTAFDSFSVNMKTRDFRVPVSGKWLDNIREPQIQDKQYFYDGYFVVMIDSGNSELRQFGTITFTAKIEVRNMWSNPLNENLSFTYRCPLSL